MNQNRKTSPHIGKLQRTHDVDGFDCGQEPLNRYLQRYALMGQRVDGAQTYVGVAGGTVIGYYTLLAGSVSYEDAPERLRKGLPRQPVPIMLLARFAVDLGWQGKGVGAGLLRDAMRRTAQAADIAGIRALLVHAKDDAAKRFYEHFDFSPSVTDPRHLFLFIRDIRRAIGL
jgi:GNAT superfamily N-acetyltransferase